MAMNKKEKQQLEDAIDEARMFRALRWSDKQFYKADVEPPKSFAKPSKGWFSSFYFHGTEAYRLVGEGWSCSVSHGSGWDGKRSSASQNPRWLYSTKLRALKAARCMAEKAFAKYLAEVDALIEEEEKNPTPGPDGTVVFEGDK